MRIFVLLPLLIVLGGCSKPSLEDSIVGKVITVALNERMQPQMGFNANGVMLVIGQDGNLEDRGLTYKIKGNEVLVFEDGERDGGLLFTSSSPKAGDQVEMGSEDGKRNVTIIKIETADEISP
ncbi:hypothetical protein OAL09_11365 [Verrucomicrobia bacterium]|nr:hypothetical protein [Verrucomicrobiota bacterium]|tara:strand:- start:81 stop:449 length:369 start_codon:yes stop_codon:yes gene_type:complete